MEDEESHQGMALWTDPWVVNSEYTTPLARSIYRVIQKKFLMGIELGWGRVSGITILGSQLGIKLMNVLLNFVGEFE